MIKIKKYKQFIIGFTLGALIFSSFTVFADQRNLSATFRNIKIALNGKQIQTDVEPFIYEGRTFVPVRFIAEAFDKEVKYNETTDTVEINDMQTPISTPNNDLIESFNTATEHKIKYKNEMYLAVVPSKYPDFKMVSYKINEIGLKYLPTDTVHIFKEGVDMTSVSGEFFFKISVLEEMGFKENLIQFQK